MKIKSLYLLVAILAALFIPRGFAAETTTPDATVLKVTGSAKAKLPGQSNDVPIVTGQKLPQGTVIITDATSEVSIQPFDGAVATVKPNSTVEIEKLSLTTEAGAVQKQTAMIGLKSGNLVNTIDPEKRKINNYSVRTPKGVAAASGTVYSVSVNASGSSFATLSGTVNITLTDNTIITVNIGTGMVVSNTPGAKSTPVALSAASAEVKAAVLEAAKTVVSLVSDNLVPTTNAGSTTTLLASVVQIANAADPVAGKTIATSAAQAVSTNSTTASQATTVQQVIQQAATQGVQLNTQQSAPAPAPQSTSASPTTTTPVTTNTTTPVTAIDVSVVSPSH